jgi:hypothetical protein
MFIHREEAGVTKRMHSLPWTLALSLAAQAGETAAIRPSSAGAMTVKESVIEDGLQEWKKSGRPLEKG